MRTLLALLILAFSSPLAQAYRGGPPSGRANEPPSGRNCSGCHGDFALNSGDLTLSLIDESAGRPMSGYEPGIAYDLRFEISSGEAERSRWGFELIPLAGEAMAGELSAGPISSLLASAGRTYLAHAPAISDPSLGSWSFSWTAPPADVGDILVWACGNAANGDSDTDGDYIECTSFLLSPGFEPGGAITRIVRWSGEANDPGAAAFAMVPCSTPNEDLRLCEETLLTQEQLDGPLPLSIPGAGTLVFIEHDSDTALPGSEDLIIVTKDPGSPGNLLVRLR